MLEKDVFPVIEFFLFLALNKVSAFFKASKCLNKASEFVCTLKESTAFFLKFRFISQSLCSVMWVGKFHNLLISFSIARILLTTGSAKKAKGLATVEEKFKSIFKLKFFIKDTELSKLVFKLKLKTSIPLSIKNICINNINPLGVTQNIKLFNLGKATSLTPNCVGNKKLPKAPNKVGITTKKTMTIPWREITVKYFSELLFIIE